MWRITTVFVVAFLVALPLAFMAGCGGPPEPEPVDGKRAGSERDGSGAAGWLEPVRECSKECVEAYSGGPATLFCIDSCDATVEAEIMHPVVAEMISCLKGCVVDKPGDQAGSSTCMDTCEAG